MKKIRIENMLRLVRLMLILHLPPMLQAAGLNLEKLIPIGLNLRDDSQTYCSYSSEADMAVLELYKQEPVDLSEKTQVRFAEIGGWPSNECHYRNASAYKQANHPQRLGPMLQPFKLPQATWQWATFCALLAWAQALRRCLSLCVCV